MASPLAYLEKACSAKGTDCLSPRHDGQRRTHARLSISTGAMIGDVVGSGASLSSKYSSRASRRLANASSTLFPWLATSTSRHLATYQSPSWVTAAVKRISRPTPSYRQGVFTCQDSYPQYIIGKNRFTQRGSRGPGYCAIGCRIQGGHTSLRRGNRSRMRGILAHVTRWWRRYEMINQAEMTKDKYQFTVRICGEEPVCSGTPQTFTVENGAAVDYDAPGTILLDVYLCSQNAGHVSPHKMSRTRPRGAASTVTRSPFLSYTIAPTDDCPKGSFGFP